MEERLLIKPLREVRINVKFWQKKPNGSQTDAAARCEKAAIPIREETEADYLRKREDQWRDAQQSGIDVNRYGRKDVKGNIILDPGVQILSGEDVKLRVFRTDLEEQDFKLVQFEVMIPHAGKPNAALFICTYSKMSKPVRKLTPLQQQLQDWFFNQIFGHCYVWRNFGGAQFDVPATSMHAGKEEDAVQLRLYNGGRIMRMGSQQVIVEFEDSTAHV